MALQAAKRRTRRSFGLLTLVMLLTAGFATSAHAAPVGLGTVGSFAVLGHTTVTNTGPSVITGDVGLSPGTSAPGFPPGIVNGTFHINDGVAAKAQNDLTTAYNDAAGRSSTATVASDLAGKTLTPGVYTASSTMGLSGALTLDAQNDPNAVFIFQVGSGLNIASASHVLLTRGAQSCNVYWQVGSSAVIDTSAIFVGNVMAMQSISMKTAATLDGRVLARNGAVTLDTNTITRSQCATGTTGGGGSGGSGGSTGGGSGSGSGGGTTGGGTTGTGGGSTTTGAEWHHASDQDDPSAPASHTPPAAPLAPPAAHAPAAALAVASAAHACRNHRQDACLAHASRSSQLSPLAGAALPLPRRTPPTGRCQGRSGSWSSRPTTRSTQRRTAARGTSKASASPARSLARPRFCRCSERLRTAAASGCA